MSFPKKSEGGSIAMLGWGCPTMLWMDKKSCRNECFVLVNDKLQLMRSCVHPASHSPNKAIDTRNGLPWTMEGRNLTRSWLTFDPKPSCWRSVRSEGMRGFPSRKPTVDSVFLGVIRCLVPCISRTDRKPVQGAPVGDDVGTRPQFKGHLSKELLDNITQAS